jgi:adenylyltransferase and sulfurtransferase
MQAGFANDEVERYSRQMLLPQVGVHGQDRLRHGRVLIVGLGGLGCPAALYLAGAGVGTLGLVDRPGDVVERSNLHRQIAHADARVGMDKVASAAAAVAVLNPHVAIERHPAFTPSNAVQLAREYDVVLDCTDNVAVRYLISDACAAAERTPLVAGAAIGLDGQLTVYMLDNETPCYRCVFPDPPPPSCVGSCDSAGVLGPVPGIVGTLQAMEAIKIIAKIAGAIPLSRRLLLFDASTMTFRDVKLRPRNVACVGCCHRTKLSVSSFDYDAFARGPDTSATMTSNAAPLPDDWRISPNCFSDMRTADGPASYMLIDVRPPEQFTMCSLPEARNVPLSAMQKDHSLVHSIHAAAGDRSIVLLCRRGNASQDALSLFRANGVDTAVDIEGGLQAWHHLVDATFPLY